ncbi:phosphotransferase family enzyme [Stackebrandtia albiflava]|uniref:Phosphotransferase family enzyme n=1 Tax=Stackebrandtia albiflava TaxID=406432 RepID=A0A562VG67_9ACTN|nr:phosphotransferase [Stackebrandtia albiflava]TWJ16906.1 phosphotransferase family enzyme [Stackebrandtia albiflava]
MGLHAGTPVRYDATAVRLGFGDLPEAVRAEIAAHLGGPPVTVRSAGGGFTGGFAAVVTSGTGRCMFVKATGPDLPFVVDAYSREAHNNTALPDTVPSPRMRFSAQVHDWVVLGFDAVDGTAPALPLTVAQWRLMLDAWARAAEALTPAPEPLRALGIPHMTGRGLHHFTDVAAGTTPPDPLPPLAVTHLTALAELEAVMPRAVAADAVTHGDLRPDNMILTGDRALICDWTALEVAACWFDTIALLIVAHGEGHDADTWLRRHPTVAGVTDEQIDSVLAAITGYYLVNSGRPPIDRVSPHLRAHQRWNGLAALDWLASRRGW